MDKLKQDEEFILVIEQNKGIIYKIANSFKKNENDKKDLVQEIIYQLWRSFSSYDSRSKISTWLYRVSLNVAISFYRQEKKKGETIPITESIIALYYDEERDEKENNLILLQQFVNELKELDRALILLYLEEKSGKEIAEILGLSETNIRTKINRIKEQLKQRFSQINN